MAAGMKISHHGNIDVEVTTAALVVTGVALVGLGIVASNWLFPTPASAQPMLLVVASPMPRSEVTPAPVPAGLRPRDAITVGFVPVTVRPPIRPRFILSGF